ncbi:MAG: rhomboid family intramembrane serine protease [Lachnospiraceae bacterium]|nr:rhomboid family intramembrane serine protease [Lachnospiraceae bacterium]MCR4927641.1 rhomboid family intramembrane serine protease [Lachnospiraceae bacterium]
MKKRTIRISLNSPVVLAFSALCLIAMGLNYLTDGWTNQHIFSVYRASLLDPLTYIRFFGHAVGHSGWSHFLNNIMLILVVGPLLEEKYGSQTILLAILVTSLITGIVYFIFFPDSRLLGASGVVFAFILMSSFTSIKNGEIPLTFLLVAALYLGEQVYDIFFVKDNVSNLTHIIGGLVGAVFGFIYKPVKKKG